MWDTFYIRACHRSESRLNLAGSSSGVHFTQQTQTSATSSTPHAKKSIQQQQKGYFKSSSGDFADNQFSNSASLVRFSCSSAEVRICCGEAETGLCWRINVLEELHGEACSKNSRMGSNWKAIRLWLSFSKDISSPFQKFCWLHQSNLWLVC